MTQAELNKLKCKASPLFIIPLYEQNKLQAVRGGKITLNAFEAFRTFARCLTEIYGDNWDLELKSESKKELYYIDSVTIRYPKITISNSRNQKHIIRDLFVRIELTFTTKSIQLGRPSGMRSTATYAEMCSYYHHSHLPGRNFEEYPRFQSFCLGSGDINITLVDINDSGIDEYKATKFLLELYSVVCYESLEGVPHMHINSIKPIINGARTVRPSISIDDTIFPTAIYTLFKNLSEEDIEEIHFNLENKELDIDWGVELDKKIISIFRKVDILRDAFLYGFNGTNFFVPTDGGGLANIPSSSNIFYFRGEPIKLQIVEIPKVEDLKEEELVLPSNIRQTLIKRIKNDINKERAETCTYNKYQDTVTHTRSSL